MFIINGNLKEELIDKFYYSTPLVLALNNNNVNDTTFELNEIREYLVDTEEGTEDMIAYINNAIKSIENSYRDYIMGNHIKEEIFNEHITVGESS